MKAEKYRELRGRIRAKFGTQEAFAKKMGMHPTSLSLKLNGTRDWTREEIAKAQEVLEIPYDDVLRYFF